MTTLIVRDATLAINGAPETRGDADAHLAERILEVEGMTEATVEECIEVLNAACGSGEDADTEVMLALTILGLARTHLLERAGVTWIALGRRAASRLEQDGDPDAALALIEAMRERNPGHGALERDYEAVLRRMGMVHDLAERYFQRAQYLLRQGKTEEATGWLKEVLLLDRSRKDVARMVRDLRLEETGIDRPSRRLSAPLLFVALIPIALVAVVQRERNLSDVYQQLPVAGSDLDSVQRRLSAVELFLERHPVWHGSIALLSERSDLRIQAAKLEDELESERETELFEFADRLEQAELIRQRARMHAQMEDLPAALADFEEALEIAPADWEHRDRVERDVVAIREHLENQGSEDQR